MTEAIQGKSGRRGISGSTIKLIALFAMLVDHTSAIIIERIIMLNLPENAAALTPEAYLEIVGRIPGLFIADTIMRLGIGRIGFPLFAFLLVEGFMHTSNARKYLTRMILFAFISEIPFDLAFRGKILEFGYQNVFFTLAIGLASIYFMKLITKHFEERKAIQYFLHLICLIAGMGLGLLLRTDYNAFGVLTIVVIFYFRNYARDRKVLATAAGCVVLVAMTPNEALAFLALIPVALYNGTKGISTKYLFYVFYPAHILILYLIAVLMGLGNVIIPS